MDLTRNYANEFLVPTFQKLGAFTKLAFLNIFTPFYWAFFPLRIDQNRHLASFFIGLALWPLIAPFAALGFVVGVASLVAMFAVAVVVFPLTLIADLFIGIGEILRGSPISWQGMLPTPSLSSTANLMQKAGITVKPDKVEKNDRIFDTIQPSKSSPKQQVIEIDDSLLIETKEEIGFKSR